VENLKTVVHKICGLREAVNAIYLAGDEEKCAQADAMAAVISTAATVPELRPVLKSLFLILWAYLESVHDVQCLLKGEAIPMQKTAENWYMDLGAVLGTSKDPTDKNTEQELQGADQNTDTGEKGTALDYRDYLRVLLVLTDLKKQTFRSMDVMETEIRNTKGNYSFRMDSCICLFQAQACIRSAYGYEMTLEKRKGYGTY
jgi:hypothetical protein